MSARTKPAVPAPERLAARPVRAPFTTLLLTPEEAAAELRIARRRLYERIASGEIPSVKIGRSRRIRRADLEKWVASLPDEQPGSTP